MSESIALMESIRDQLVDAILKLQESTEPQIIPYDGELNTYKYSAYRLNFKYTYPGEKAMWDEKPDGIRYWPTLLELARLEKRLSKYIELSRGKEPS